MTPFPAKHINTIYKKLIDCKALFNRKGEMIAWFRDDEFHFIDKPKILNNALFYIKNTK